MIDLELTILLVVGIIIHILFKGLSAYRSGKSLDVKFEGLNAALSFMTGATIIYLQEDIKELFVVTSVSAVMLGYIGHSIFRGLFPKKSFKKQAE